ncbi:MAG: DUF502 domain-containing protein [Rhizobiales bacterium]|nr:DUF502 domain-containing protein [Hyphomicrobiales bacterium]
MSRLARTFIAGLLVILPIVLTIVLVVWVGNIIFTFVGPHSVFGTMLITLGFGFSASTWVAYLSGVLIVALCIYVLGLIIESRLEHSVHNIIGNVMQRIPLIGYIYDLARRLIAIVERKDDGTFSGMRPVWCFFGGEGGAAVLALLPSPEAVTLNGERYHVVLIPSAPVPVGGALIYVPAKWVKPADIGIEGLMSIYVAMGVAPRQPGVAPAVIKPPPVVPSAPTVPQEPPPAAPAKQE